MRAQTNQNILLQRIIRKLRHLGKSGYFNFHVNSNANVNKHYFLSEELLVPHTNNTDT